VPPAHRARTARRGRRAARRLSGARQAQGDDREHAGGAGRRAVRGGRGFRGDVQADVGAFLEGDPGRGMRGSTDIHSPLVDPRLGESF